MADSSPQLSLAVGDRVVYPNQGVCRVSGVETKEVAGQRLTFVTMKREEDGALVMVPQTKVQTIGLRKVATADEVAKIFAFLKSDSDKANLDWKRRRDANSGRMAQGGLLGMAEVVKGLQVLSELRPLPTKERELYDNARHLLVAEVSVAMGISECDAEDSVDVILFPVGKERPKRTAEEFKAASEESDDGLGLDEDLDLDAPGLDLPAEEDAAAEAPAEEEEAPAKATKSIAVKRVVLTDDDETQPTGSALLPADLVPARTKRGRPPMSAAAAAAPVPPAEVKAAARTARPGVPRPAPAVETKVAARAGRPSATSPAALAAKPAARHAAASPSAPVSARPLARAATEPSRRSPPKAKAKAPPKAKPAPKAKAKPAKKSK